jgi:cytochrome P450
VLSASPAGRVESRTAPGPAAFSPSAVRALFALRRAPCDGFADALRRYGPVVHFPFGARSFYLLARPAHVEHVLCTNARHYDKGTPTYGLVRDILGQGVFTSEGPRWRTQRRVVQPALSAAPKRGLVELSLALTEPMLNRWHDAARRGALLDLTTEMTQLALAVVATHLFGNDARAQGPAIAEALNEVLSESQQRINRLLPWPRTWPSGGNRRFARALHRLRAEARGLVDALPVRSAESTPASDLLGALGAHAGSSADELRDQILTLYLAGHETTATVLGWTLALLARHPAVAASIESELERVLGGRSPSLADLEHLPRLRAALEESLRLYPPVWLVERRALEPDVIGGYAIPRGATLALSIHSLHRDPECWPMPERFEPERFIGARPVPGSYLPFGSGPRKCAGAEFAMVELMSVLASILSRFELESVDALPAPSPGLTLRASRALLVRPHARH